jgi:glycosyltransferase involved in cell wall biosynthesis
VSALARLLLVARRLRSRLQWGVSGRNAVSQRRVRAFLAAHAPLAIESRAALSFAVVVPCYNHARFLPSAFASIEAQTRRPTEVVLVDDASTDETWRLVNDLVAASPLPREVFRLVRNQENLGQCATINVAVTQAESDVLVVLNDDDYLMHDALEWIDRVLRQHPTAALVGARGFAVGAQPYFDNLKKDVTAALLSNDLAVRLSEPAAARRYTSARQLDMCHSGSAFRREAWRAAGGYYADRKRRVVLFSDRDFQLRVNYLYPVAVVDNAAFAFWRAGSSVDAGLFT